MTFSLLPIELNYLIAHQLPLTKLVCWSRYEEFELDDNYFRQRAITKHGLSNDDYEQRFNGPWREDIDYDHIGDSFYEKNIIGEGENVNRYIPLINYLAALGPGIKYRSYYNAVSEPEYLEELYDVFSIEPDVEVEEYYSEYLIDIFYRTVEIGDLDLFEYYYDVILNIGELADIELLLISARKRQGVTQKYIHELMWRIALEYDPSLSALPKE